MLVGRPFKIYSICVWSLFFMLLTALFLFACASKTAVKMMPSPELEYTDGMLTFVAKQVLDGEKFEISLNPHGKSVGLVFTPIPTDSTHHNLAKLIYKQILSSKEFREKDGLLAFRTDAFYGFAACWLFDMQNVSPVKFADMIGKNTSYVLKVECLWREIMLLGKRKHYTNGIG